MKRKLLYNLLGFILICTICVLVCCVKSKNTIAIIGAMDSEINEIRSNLKHTRTIQKNDFIITKGTLGNNNIVLAKSGVGKVAASTTAQFIIDEYNPIYIINTGIAGSLSPNMKAGSVVIGENMVQHDFDVTAFGNPRGYIDNGIEPDKPTVFHSDNKLIEIFKKESAANLILGTIATGDIFINQKKQKQEIRNEFHADIIDMESAAIAQTAQRNNIPLLVIRTISDSENDSVSEYNNNKKTSAAKAAFVIISVLNKI